MIRQRLITAVLAGILLLALLFAVPPTVARPVIAALLILAGWEWSAFLDTGSRGRYGFVALIAALILPVLVWPEAVSNRTAVFVIAVAWWCVTLVWTFFYPTAIARPVAWLGGILVIVPAYVALDWLYQLGPTLLLFMLGIVLAADIGAFFVGRGFGKVKLAKQISPGKTWEGLIGGLLAVAVLTVVESRVLGLPLVPVLALSLAVAMISVIGDLTVSMFKRNAGLKDSGTLFPGHGGFLDRADSITAAAPLFCLGLSWLKPSLLGLPS
jgi:phosphatidate cytidylyltransferase